MTSFEVKRSNVEVKDHSITTDERTLNIAYRHIA